MRKILPLLVFNFLIFTYGCQPATNNKAEKPVDLNDGIQTSIPEDVGMNEVIIKEIIDSIHSGFYPNRHSLLIYKDEKLVVEKYFTGQDNRWGTDLGTIAHNDTVLHDVRRISKSVVSACIGIAIAQGRIERGAFQKYIVVIQ